MKQILDEIKRNSNIPEKCISEASDVSDLTTTIDVVGGFIEEKYNDSLGYLISEVIPLKGSWGVVYASKRDGLTEDFEIVRKDIHTKTFKVKTGYTRENWQDVMKMFGQRSKKQASNILAGLSAYVENEDVIKFINNNSFTKPVLQVDTQNSAWITSQISQRVAASVLEMNKESFKSLDSFCILSARWAAAFLGTASYVKSDSDVSRSDASLFVGRYGRTDFYVNPFRNDYNQFNDDYNSDFPNTSNGLEYCYVGLKSEISGYSSLVFAPYQYEVQSVVDPETGNDHLFIYNRYGLVTSPLHEPLEGKTMLHKFLIEEAS